MPLIIKWFTQAKYVSIICITNNSNKFRKKSTEENLNESLCEDLNLNPTLNQFSYQSYIPHLSKQLNVLCGFQVLSVEDHSLKIMKCFRLVPMLLVIPLKSLHNICNM